MYSGKLAKIMCVNSMIIIVLRVIGCGSVSVNPSNSQQIPVNFYKPQYILVNLNESWYILVNFSKLQPIVTVLDKYVCILPPSQDLPLPLL